MSRWKPKSSGVRRGKGGGGSRGDTRSTVDRPVYHTYLMGEGWTFYITDVIPRSEHRPFMDVFERMRSQGGRHEATMHGTPWGTLIITCYDHSKTSYVETEAQFRSMLRRGKHGPN
jgi:hypothetical protein